MTKKLKKAAKVVGATAAVALAAGLTYKYLNQPNVNLTRNFVGDAYRNLNSDMYALDPLIGRRVAYNRLSVMANLSKPKIYPSSGNMTMEQAFGYDWA
jgi:hypothetical protein